MKTSYLLTVCMLWGSAQAVEPVRLVTSVNPALPASPAHRLLFKDWFGRINTPFTLEYRPNRRAEIEFKNGKFDGDVARISLFTQNYPTAIRVDPSYLALEYYAISNALEIRQWSDLYQHSIAYMLGTRAVENQLSQSSQLNPVNTARACLAMVQTRRVDVCVIQNGTITEAQLESAKTQFKVQLFATLNVHLWLAPTQQKLAQQLSAALIQMQKDGTLERHQKAMLNPEATPGH
ncbi:substrate-binding periplasmic protein [Chitinibacter sp. S2-10]|uniref:substrate-binding periplasmic protein n=1 Tax=Chitinibacter sp. S2-10 TaxID=3373597 RepID=UPI0039777E88